MFGFILTRRTNPRDTVRLYQFPYRIAEFADNRTHNPWEPGLGLKLCGNLRIEGDLFGVNQKLLRLGEQIVSQHLDINIITIVVAFSEVDVLEVFIDGDVSGDIPQTWKRFDSCLSTAFGLPVKL